MMTVVLQRSALQQPISVTKVGQLAVYNPQGDLLAIMWARDDGTIALTRAGEADFATLVRQMGLEKRTDVRCITVDS